MEKRKDYLQTFCEQKEGPEKQSTAELISYLSPFCSDYFFITLLKVFFPSEIQIISPTLSHWRGQSYKQVPGTSTGNLKRRRFS